ncbi:MAG TPA: LON peptidase substrate-binding domain-containing protein, partial [Dehalococcoidia bacterium]|nr:LON peptidase substrate-binding domain-containing protein [Dehalococcoidia bacterium]
MEEVQSQPPRAGDRGQVKVPDVVPVIASGASVMFPAQLMPVVAVEERDVRAIDEAAASGNKVIGIFAQKAKEGQYSGEMYETGTAATLNRM